MLLTLNHGNSKKRKDGMKEMILADKIVYLRKKQIGLKRN